MEKYNRLDSRRVAMRGLTPDKSGVPRDALLHQEYANFLSDFFTFAHDSSSNPVLAGGIARFSDFYSPSRVAKLDLQFSRDLVALVDTPTAVWVHINDFANLAASVGIPPAEGGA